MPPKFMELPKPGEETFEKEITVIDEAKTLKIFLIQKNLKYELKKSDSAEDFVLKQLKDK